MLIIMLVMPVIYYTLAYKGIARYLSRRRKAVEFTTLLSTIYQTGYPLEMGVVVH